jgi:hypothetical protein
MSEVPWFKEGTDPRPDDSEVKSLQKINAVLQEGAAGIPGMAIPVHDSVHMTYVGSTNNLNTVVYKLAGSTRATLTFVYVGGTPSADDAKVESITKS